MRICLPTFSLKWTGCFYFFLPGFSWQPPPVPKGKYWHKSWHKKGPDWPVPLLPTTLLLLYILYTPAETSHLNLFESGVLPYFVLIESIVFELSWKIFNKYSIFSWYFYYICIRKRDVAQLVARTFGTWSRWFKSSHLDKQDALINQVRPCFFDLKLTNF